VRFGARAWRRGGARRLPVAAARAPSDARNWCITHAETQRTSPRGRARAALRAFTAAVADTHCPRAVFCTACLEEWLTRRAACPACNAPLGGDGVAPLRAAAPLAWRVLGRVRVRCPLHAQGCPWAGDYSEVSHHLTSSDTHRGGAYAAASSPAAAAAASSAPDAQPTPADAAARARAEAEGLKEAGNEKMAARAFNEAVKLYSKALSLCPSPVYYANRAAAWLAVGAAREAASDCRAALALDSRYSKAHVRLARALGEAGEADAAAAHLEAAAAAGAPPAELAEAHRAASELATLLRAGREALATGDWATAAAAYDEAGRRCGAPAAALGAAAAALGRGAPDRALRLTLGVLRADPACAEAFALRGAAFLQQGDFSQADALLREALRLAPDDARAAGAFRAARRAAAAAEAGRAAAFSRDFDAALARFTEALAAVQALPPAAPLVTQLLCERAAAALRLKAHDACLADCEAALAAREDCKPAFITRASCLRALGRAADAVASLKPALEMDPADAVLQKHYEQASFDARKAARPDYYALLGCGRTAGGNDVKVAYKARAMECHPDRLPPDATSEERAAAEERFKAIGEALDILSEPLKKQLYDEGYDKAAIEERVAAAARAAHEHRGGKCGGGGCGSSGCG
jgi:DnaJ family protein C protein 7